MVVVFVDVVVIVIEDVVVVGNYVDVIAVIIVVIVIITDGSVVFIVDVVVDLFTFSSRCLPRTAFSSQYRSTLDVNQVTCHSP